MWQWGGMHGTGHAWQGAIGSWCVAGDMCGRGCACIKPDKPINVYARFCLNTAKSKFSLVSPFAD